MKTDVDSFIGAMKDFIEMVVFPSLIVFLIVTVYVLFVFFVVYSVVLYYRTGFQF
jgi:hypothetical protein